MMNLRSIRERINIILYDSKDQVTRILSWGTLVVSSLAMVLLVIYHGFNLDSEQKALILLLIRVSLAYYILKYIAGFVYHFHPLQYLRKSWFEGGILLLATVNFIGFAFFDYAFIQDFGARLGIESLDTFYILFLQSYFLLVMGIELGNLNGLELKLDVSPPTLLLLSFLLLISLGTLLLSLPEMSATGLPLNFMDALFTSISASCVTGLVVVDTAMAFSAKGQFVLLFLMQLGGLNIISFATFIVMFSRRGVGIKQQSMLQENLSAESFLKGNGLLKQIFIFSFGIELIGAVILYFLWSPDLHFQSNGERLFFSAFHSVSAFNNAGFSLFSEGLYAAYVRDAFVLHICIALLIFFGGLGFPAMREMFDAGELRERANKPWKSYSLNTKIALYASVILILLGAGGFWVLEGAGVLADMNAGERIVASFFQSITTRTAGFNTVDIGSLGQSTWILMMFLMFIGASSGSTGGGIKTSTFTLIFASAWATIRGKKNVEMMKHSIGSDLLNKAFTIFLFSATFIFIAIFALSITDGHIPLTELAFEEISAFSTVGLSTGITAELSDAGRWILMLSMFIGRVGTLTLAFSLSKPKDQSNYDYPKASLLVG